MRAKIPKQAHPVSLGPPTHLTPKLQNLLTDIPDHSVTFHPTHAHRHVTLIVGPPGAGKTTLALALHPATVDLADIPPGTPRERMRQYGRLVWQAGNSPYSNIAIINGAPLLETRRKLETQGRPFATVVLAPPADICHARVDARGRDGVDGRDITGQHHAIDEWFRTAQGRHETGTHQQQTIGTKQTPTGIPKHERNRRANEARTVTDRAYANPTTLCCNCHQPLERCGPQHNGHNRNGTPITWDAGHPDGRWTTGELRAECSFCNRRAGAQAGNRTREPHSELW